MAEAEADNAFQILIATLLSARTQDATTAAASARLFARARTPRAMAALPVREIEKLIYPVSFYRNKAEHVKACCEMLLTRFGGRVPDTLEELVQLPGVGRKTANLVLILAFKSRENICVDTHVHRISNRLGWVATKTPGRDRAGAVSRDAPALVVVDQPVAGDLGAERVPPGASALRRLRDRRGLSKNWRGRTAEDRQPIETASARRQR